MKIGTEGKSFWKEQQSIRQWQCFVNFMETILNWTDLDLRKGPLNSKGEYPTNVFCPCDIQVWRR